MLKSVLSKSNTGIQDLALNILHALLKLPSTRLLSSKSYHGTIRSDLLKLNSAISSDNYDFDRIKPVLNAVLDGKPDSEIWDQVYSALPETASPRAMSYSSQQSSYFHAGSFPNSEYRQNVTYLKNGTAQLRESTLNISEPFRENETVGAGISSWVHRFDAVAKCYTADDGKEREREVAVFDAWVRAVVVGKRLFCDITASSMDVSSYNLRVMARSDNTYDLLFANPLFQFNSNGQNKLRMQSPFFIRKECCIATYPVIISFLMITSTRWLGILQDHP